MIKFSTQKKAFLGRFWKLSLSDLVKEKVRINKKRVNSREREKTLEPHSRLEGHLTSIDRLVAHLVTVNLHVNLIGLYFT